MIITINTEHSVESLRVILSDPSFLLPRLFPTIRKLEVMGSSFNGVAKYLTFEHRIYGNVFFSVNEITYPFTLVFRESTGTGRITITLLDKEVRITLDYEGWMGFLSKGLLKRWLESFSKDFNEVIRLERIKRKI
ncbi:DUF3211 domain-containing protein [Metallosphaera tengchongensis]|uniref:DUF3211 domain-containing protein n=1 Tax=Metallosphaera tengchongensis TaxID=1532350 RepID=A0A6N0NZ20_9CREN|nr:DUF3211 domain-containing protein [Metallosphaera tengchongensis]QKR00789.1 DUF3211 domain-containing protein [Metallosphaera tengchongensis]